MPTYIILDGVDELVHKSQRMALSFLTAMLLRHSKMKIIVTSRSEKYWVQKVLQSHTSLRLSPSLIGADIEQYVGDQINNITTPSPLLRNALLKQEVLETPVARAHRT